MPRGEAKGDDGVEAKLGLLRLAEELGNVSLACAQTGYSRDSYYRFKRAYAAGGTRALGEMVPARPRPKNRVAPEIERAVIALRRARPDWGAGRIAADLARRMGLAVSATGVRGILARNAPASRMADDARGGERAAKPQKAKNPRSDMAALILNEAFTLFAEKNYSTVTMKDLADTIGINPSLIHYYFGSKEGLFLQVVEKAATDAHATFLDIRQGEEAPARIIELWIMNHARQFLLMQNLIKISVDYANTHNADERINQAIRKFYAIEAEILRAALQDGMARGDFRRVDIDKVSTFISTFLDGVLVRSVMFSEFSHDTAIDDLAAFVMEHLRG